MLTAVHIWSIPRLWPQRQTLPGGSCQHATSIVLPCCQLEIGFLSPPYWLFCIISLPTSIPVYNREASRNASSFPVLTWRTIQIQKLADSQSYPGFIIQAKSDDFTFISRRHFRASISWVNVWRWRDAIVSLQQAHGCRNRAPRWLRKRIQGTIFGRAARSPLPKNKTLLSLQTEHEGVYQRRRSTELQIQVYQQRSPLIFQTQSTVVSAVPKGSTWCHH